MILRILLISFLLVGCERSAETFRVPGSPIEFRLEPSTMPNVYATYKGGTVETSQILDNNPVFLDLKNQENLIRVQFILRKFAEETKGNPANLDIFLPAPKQPIAELAKASDIALHPKTKVTFKETAPDKDVIAQWEDQQIKTSDVDVASARLALVRTRAYKENLNRLKGILVRRTLLAAAQAEKMEIEEYIRKHIIPNEESLTETEFEKFLASSNIKKADIIPIQEKSLRLIALEKRKNAQIENYVVKNLLKEPVVVHEFPPSFKVQVPEGWQSIWGLAEAPVSVLFFGDFVCGPCRDSLKNVIAAKKEYNGNVKVGFNFLFSNSDRDSRMLSEAALCTQAQGTKYFRKFAEIYATNPPGVDEAAIEQAVKDSGASVDTYKKCFLAREHQALLNQHLDFASRVGVTSQPTILIDGEPMEGAINPEDLNETVRRKVQAKATFFGSLWRKVKAMVTDN